MAAGLLEEHIDLDSLLHESKKEIEPEKQKNRFHPSKQLKIAFARDEAFNFTYQANLDRLNERGTVSFFSPLNDDQLPDADLVWLPGGYPELFLSKLCANGTMMQQIREHVDTGRALLAECGGMMYLGKSITDKQGIRFPMTGLFDLHTSFEQMRLQLGYRQILAEQHEWRGHEFHFSVMETAGDNQPEVEVRSAGGNRMEMPVLRRKNAWGSYLHLYLGEEEKMSSFLRMLKVGEGMNK